MDVKIVKALRHGLSYISGDGWWSIDPIHRSLIDAVLATLESANASIVREQLNNKYFVQWWSGGRISPLFFDRPQDIPVIEDPAFSDNLFKVELFIDDKRYTAHVVFYEGRIYAVEMKIPRKFYRNKPYRVGKVTKGSPKNSYTGVIDRAAHGKETETNP